jgi:coproporphyrinogen III oxidase-like Fe-S oxidoreductase
VFHSCEALTPAARRIERLMLGLRVREGVDTAALERELGVVAIEPGALSAYNRRLARGDVSHDAGRLRIPSTRWLFADSIIRDLV